MRSVLHFIKRVSLWGIIFLLLLVFVFKVKFTDITSLALTGPNYLNAVCIFMLLSIIVFPIFLFLANYKQGVSILVIIALNLSMDLSIPHRGFTVFHDARKERDNPDVDKMVFASDIGTLTLRFIETIIWWAIALFCIFEIFHIDNNAIAATFSSYPVRHVLFLIACIVVAYILINIAVSIICPKIMRWSFNRNN